jgi:transposase
MIAAIVERCVGIDIGKKSLSACVMTGPADGEARFEIRTLGTTVAELQGLRDWIQQEHFPQGALHSRHSLQQFPLLPIAKAKACLKLGISAGSDA